MLTERAAWLHLARCWDEADESGDAVVCGLEHTGLCFSIGILFQCGKISRETWESMRTKINLQPKHFTSSMYLWPLTQAGAKQRAAWCRKQAAALVSKPKRTAK